MRLIRTFVLLAIVYAALGLGLWVVHADNAAVCTRSMAREAILSRAEGVFYLDRPSGVPLAYSVFWGPAALAEMGGRQSVHGFILGTDCFEEPPPAP
ncbi:hypothetical protein [Chthonobacter albigriseus]|uniref:hypothetical protein n=1 Tax=Chthonobacter albigriseus TaxID=1683161 RepID=UPI0015EED9E3|nr:hypothetical protein [Chthonobacter albigriseus]